MVLSMLLYYKAACEISELTSMSRSTRRVYGGIQRLMDGWIDGWMDRWIDGQTDRQIDR